MATCVKVQLMRNVVTVLQAIPSVKKVSLWPLRIPEESPSRPFIAVYDEPEIVTHDNLWRRAQFVLHIEAYLTASTLNVPSEQLDELHAQIHAALHSMNTIAQYALQESVVRLEETHYEKFVFNEGECGLVNKYEASYVHVWGDPYKQS